MVTFHNRSFHIIVHVQAFICLCMAMFFICKSNNVFAYDYGPSGYPATPTPIPTFYNYSVSVLNYDGYTHQSFLDYPTLQVSNDRNVNFFDTFLPYCLNLALENLDKYNNTTYSNNDYSFVIDTIDDIYDFNPNNPFVAFNFYFDNGSIIVVPDYHINHFNHDPSKYFTIDYDTGTKIFPYSVVSSFVYFNQFQSNSGKQGFYSFYAATEEDSYTLSNGIFGLYLRISGNDYSGSFSTWTSNGVSVIDLYAYNFYDVDAPTRVAYRFREDGSSSTLYSFSSENLVPLIIMNPIYSFKDSLDTSNGSWSVTMSTSEYGVDIPKIKRTRLNPLFETSQIQEFIQEYYNPVTWFDTYFDGLTYQLEYTPVDFTPTPIPTFGVIYTPTPFPTNIFNPTVTPINLPLNPIIQIGDYGKPWDFISGIIPLLHSALNSGTVHLFVQTIEYIYNTSLFFEIILFLIPSICLIAFILGRLKRK